MTLIPREKLAGKVYNILKEMIANYRFQPGTRLNIEQLSREMGVSRTPVWEAVGRLQQEGLLVTVPNKGVYLAALTPETALDLYAVREVLEGMAGRLAAEKITIATLAKLEESLAAQKIVVLKKDLVEYSRLDFEFHATIYESGGNVVLQELLETIKTKMRPLSLELAPVLGSLYIDHKNLVKALETRNPQRAERAFKEHNRKMIALIQEKLEGGAWRSQTAI